MKTKTILLIEDDYVDVTSVKRALAKLNVKHRLHVAHNGVDALAIINGDSTGSKVLPDIILLDLNMPKMSGLEFLGIIKNYYSLKNIKVFVMTTSAEEYDIVSTQQLGVHGYILKPLDFEKNKKDRFSGSVENLKDELMNNSKMNTVPLIAGMSPASYGIKAKLLALKKAGLASANYIAGVKAAAVGITAVATVAFTVNQVKKQEAGHKAPVMVSKTGVQTVPEEDTAQALTEVVPEKTPVNAPVHAKPVPKKIKPVREEKPVPVVISEPVHPQPRSIKIAVSEEGENEERENEQGSETSGDVVQGTRKPGKE